LESYVKMLRTVTARMERLLEEGKTIEEVVAAKPTKEFDGMWGKGFLPPEKWVKIVCRSLKANQVSSVGE